ncbi:hypothetical protein QOZ80_3AG0250650 [Eleusine coracana subsp. coracana]|nr:hypothetical protein QOZ80_3AG0250650 [Eleusine coracana subsp. coracana]
MGNPRPLARTTPSWWCGHCGMSLAAFPAPRSGSSVRCAFCHRVTHIELQHGEHESGLIAAFVAPARLPVPESRELPSSYPRSGCKKRALLVAVSYTNSSLQLDGPINDVREMRRLLCVQFAFPSDCVLELTEKETDPYRVPTRENLLRAMRWLVEGSSSGDSLVFHFSGHGTQEPDLNGDEVDGYNEALCPLDVERSGKILDDEINDIMVRPLGRGVKLHAIIDTCHSGTMLDLPYLCRQSSAMGYWQWENHCNPGMGPKRPCGGLAISISSCRDDQRCAETTGERGSLGVMTESFIKAVDAEPGTTYGRLLSAMRVRICDGHGNRRLRGPLKSFVRRVMSSSAQEPQLCSSEVFDIYRKPDDLTTTSWQWQCRHCGTGLVASPAPGSGSGVRCAFCYPGTRIEPQHGERERGLITAFLAPPRVPITESGKLAFPSSYPRVSGKKRTLLVGMSYTGTSHELEGPINNVREMRCFLCQTFGFPSSCILELTDDQENPLDICHEVKFQHSGDSLVFHFSRHGTQELDSNDGEEVDGYNEPLCPMDIERSCKILDDEINEAIVRPLDLPYLCRQSRYATHKPR